MVKLKEYSYGMYNKILRLSDNDFKGMLLNGSLMFSHSNKQGNWYRDCGMSIYLLVY